MASDARNGSFNLFSVRILTSLSENGISRFDRPRLENCFSFLQGIDLMKIWEQLISINLINEDKEKEGERGREGEREREDIMMSFISMTLNTKVLLYLFI